MKHFMQVTTGIALCFEYASWLSPADSQQPNPEEFLRSAVCDQFHIDRRASNPLRPVALPPQQTCTTPTKNGFLSQTPTALLARSFRH